MRDKMKIDHKIKRRFFACVLCLGILIGCTAAGCGRGERPDPVPDDKKPAVDEQTNDETKDKIVDKTSDKNTEAPAKIQADPAESGYAAFSSKLLKKARVEGESTLISPISVAIALGMTANGSGGVTKTEFQKLFGMDLDMLNAYCVHAMDEYTKSSGSTEAKFANGIWHRPQLKLSNEFTKSCEETYKAEVSEIDMQSPEAVDQVNQWVSKATNDMIPEIVKDFSEDAALLLVNAVYMKNSFEEPFDEPHSEWTMDFTAQDGTVSHPRGMSSKRQQWYMKDQKGEGVILPYDDGKLGLLLMRPDDGVSLTDYLSGWGEDTIRNLLNKRECREMELYVPRYELTWGGSLSNTIRDMGLTSAFEGKTADFSAMLSGSEAKKNDMYISDIIHKTVLKVNEKGTEAAAVTAVEMGEKAAALTEHMTLSFNRPFICAIVNMKTGAPLFLGTVETLP